MTQTTLLDADSHVSEPLNFWQERLPAKYRDIAPHMETEYQGQARRLVVHRTGSRAAQCDLGFRRQQVARRTARIIERLLLRRRAPRRLGSGAAA